MKNSCIRKVSILSLFFIFSTYLFIHSVKAESDSLELAKQLLNEGIRTYNTSQIQEAKDIFVEQSTEQTSDYVSAYYAALSYLALSDVKNFEMRKSSDSAEKSVRKAERVSIAAEGLPYADRSIELKEDFSESHRVKAALLSNMISGMVSGMRNGRLAEVEVLRALEIDSNNDMARIENARRLVNKPRLLGGDVQKGIEILRIVIKESPELDKGYLNLGFIHYERGELELAANLFKELLTMNPDNPEARFFVNKLAALE